MVKKRKKKTSKKKRKSSKKRSSKKRKKTKKKRSKKKKAKRKTTHKKPKKKPPVKAKSAESRTHPRVPLRLKIDYFKDPGVFLYDYSRNLGQGGLFIETEEPFTPGTDLHLSFILPEQSETVELMGKVRWVHKRVPGKPFHGVPGMGIQFQNPESKYKESLDHFFREIDYDNLTF